MLTRFSRTWLFTPAFCKAKMLQDCLEHLYKDPDLKVDHHVIIDNHYPVKKEENREKIRDLAEKYSCLYVDSGRDLGLHVGVNRAMAMVGVDRQDVFLGCDPDDRPSPGWTKAMQDVMTTDLSVAVCAMNFWVLPWKQKKEGAWPEETIANHRVWRHPGVEMWNVAAFNMPLVHNLGGFRQPNKYYGGIEVALYEEWTKRMMKLVYLIDHTSEHVLVNREDPEIYDNSYGKWKIEHATKGYGKSFEEYLKEEL